jgi:HNH endonuclease
MSITDNAAKLLWGRAAGICSNPSCRDDLTVLIEGARAFNIGEMAHVIARSAEGPRGDSAGGGDAYENLILLCPTCHRKIDKAPEGVYAVELLYQWKAEHERMIRSIGSNLSFLTRSELKVFVSRILAENKALWRTFGPASDVATNDPGSNLFEVWALRKLDRILPNNAKIINALERNFVLLNSSEAGAFLEFKNHAAAFERHQYQRLDTYPTFPLGFEQLMQP